MATKTEYDVEANGESGVAAVVRVTERAQELVGSIGQTADSAAQVVQDTLRRTKRRTRVAMKNVSEGIQTSTDYLTEKGVAGTVEDVEILIRRYPFQALLIGLSIGCLLSRYRKR